MTQTAYNKKDPPTNVYNAGTGSYNKPAQGSTSTTGSRIVDTGDFRITDTGDKRVYVS